MVTSTSYAFLLLIPLLSLLVVSSDAFGISLQASQLQKYRTAASTVVLRGISEWRDKMYDISDGTYNNEEDDDEYDQLFRTTSDSPPLKQLCLAPFPIQDALLPGETKHMHLFRVDHFASFVQLFDHSMQHDESMLGMLLFYNNRLDSRSTMPLCEIESYSRMGDDKKLGYIVNLRVVGRGHMVDILEDEPYMKAVCQEVQDDPLSQGLEVLNKAANVVVRMMDELSKLEEELLPVLKKAKQNNSTHPESTRLEGYSIMQRRAVVAKLNDLFYSKDDDNEDEEEDDSSEMDTRNARFRQAYQDALASDTQGYQVTASNSTLKYTIQELTAISWALFCTNHVSEQDSKRGNGTTRRIHAYRMQALESTSVFERLKLAYRMLRSERTNLRYKLVKAGLEVRAGDPDKDWHNKRPRLSQRRFTQLYGAIDPYYKDDSSSMIACSSERNVPIMKEKVHGLHSDTNMWQKQQHQRTNFIRKEQTLYNQINKHRVESHLVSVPKWIPSSLRSYHQQSSTLTHFLQPDEARTLRDRVRSGFAVTSFEKIPSAVLFRGHVVNLTAIVATQPADPFQLLVLQDRTTNMFRNQQDYVVLATPRHAQPNKIRWKSTIPSAILMSAYTLCFSLSCYALNPTVLHGDSGSILRTIAPLGAGIGAIFAASELARRAVSWRHLRQRATTTPMNDGRRRNFSSILRTRSDLLDVALTAPACAFILSLLLMVAGALGTARATTAIMEMPVVPVAMLRSSVVARSVLTCILPKLMTLPISQPVPISPLFLMGWAGCKIVALQFLLLSQQACAACWGFEMGSWVSLLLMGSSCLVFRGSMPGLVLLALYAQRNSDVPAGNEMTPVSNGRRGAWIASLVASILSLAPFPGGGGGRWLF